MKIKVLVENTSISPEYKTKHGLSLYIETNNHKILVDLGSDDTFIKNANKLNVDLANVDTVIISHGHNDHGGALKLFLDINKNAKIYVHKNAFEKYFLKSLGIPISISLDESLKKHQQIYLVDENFAIDEELFLFSNITDRKYFSTANKALFIKTDGNYILDDFNHEQNLIIKEGNNSVLFGGCAHNGVVNILNKANSILGYNPTHIISGFHLYNPANFRTEDKELILGIGKELKDSGSKYYTCHCTGKKAYNILKNEIGNNIEYIAAGQEFNI